MTLSYKVSVAQRSPMGELNDVIESNHLGVRAIAPWYVRWH